MDNAREFYAPNSVYKTNVEAPFRDHGKRTKVDRCRFGRGISALDEYFLNQLAGVRQLLREEAC